MPPERSAVFATVVLVAAAGGVVAYDLGLAELPGEDDHHGATVTLYDENGSRLATVEARVADTRSERIRGLSDTDSLENGSGMLFVHPDEGNHTYVMREMDFPLDIVFVEACEGDCPGFADGRVTIAHEAPVPPESNDELTPYEGHAKWVLEVPRGFATDRGIGQGSYVRIEFDS